MTTLEVRGTLTAADTPARRLHYRLLPYGQPGSTSAGRVTAARGVVDLPDPGSVFLNIEHDRTRRVAVCTELVDTADALLASFTVARTPAGDELLAEAAEGMRTGVSVELSDVRIRGGALLAGRLTGAGAVTVPAFDDARLLELVASDTPDEDTPTDPGVDPDVETPTDPDVDPGVVPATVEEPPMTDTTATAAEQLAAPAGLTASAGPIRTAPRVESFSDLVAGLHAAGQGEATRELLAALSDVATPSVTSMPPQWVGELWSGNTYARRVVPLLTSGTLTSLVVNGWRWNPAPEVDTWTGDKTAVPSNAADTEAATANATRLAGAHDLPIEHVHFDTGVVESYYRAMSNSYARKSDAYAAAQTLAGATVNATVVHDLVSAVLIGAIKVAEVGTPTFALCNPGDLVAVSGTKAADAPAFFDVAISFTGEGTTDSVRLVAHPGITAGKVVVGDRAAASFYELPGSPIRVQAVDLVKGGADAGVFGYAAELVHDKAALQVLTITAAP